MFKVMLLVKRKPGMSMEDFVDYYENVHAARDKSGSGIVHYARHYLRPAPSFTDDETAEPPFDAVTEVWYSDRAAYDAIREKLVQKPAWVADVVADEERFMDRARCRTVFVDSRVSEMHP
ncbi:hypothetical protein GCM10009836_24190 [Pseudonocardia ailaonensis]|uniref:EthD domain-containing protein n=1 Tax=Pseudonocardia ailaonensis TaxID=367279 RepID=A0ABN2MY78_9PSEU